MSTIINNFYAELISGKQHWSDYVDNDISFCVSAPIDELEGIDALHQDFWEPLEKSFKHLCRRPFIELANTDNNQTWHCATGIFTGLFTESYLSIPATGKMVSIRFTEMVNIIKGKIKTYYLILDFLDLMKQADVYPLRQSLGNNAAILPPMTMDGLLPVDSDPKHAQKTELLVKNMLDELGRFDGKSLNSMQLDKYWHEDFIWYGPAGIGTTFGINGFRRHHQGPFVFSFPDRVVDHCAAFVASGNYAATGGWPHMHGTHLKGGWLGLPATQTYVALRVMDIWRRDGELLKENWVAIDIIDICRQMGLDLFAMMRDTINLTNQSGILRSE